MTGQEWITGQPLLLPFVVVACLLVIGYFWGRRRNRDILVRAFGDLMEVMQPSDQTFTNIGGAIGFHAVFEFKKHRWLAKVEATILLLPRQALLYLPIAWLLRRRDGLYVTLHLKQFPPPEGHLIEVGLMGMGVRSIAHREKMERETLRWGRRRWAMLYADPRTRPHLARLMETVAEPGALRHVAIVPNQKKCFVYLVPRRREVVERFKPVFEWLPSLVQGE